MISILIPVIKRKDLFTVRVFSTDDVVRTSNTDMKTETICHTVHVTILFTK